MALKVFNASEIEQFIEDRYVVLHEAFSREDAAAVRDEVWKLTGLDPHDSQSWTQPVVHLQETLKGPKIDRIFTPRLFNAFDDLMGAGNMKSISAGGRFRFPVLRKNPGANPKLAGMWTGNIFTTI